MFFKLMPRICLLLVALALVGCVTTRAEGDVLRSDMRMLKDEMARMNRAQMEDKALLVEKLGRCFQSYRNRRKSDPHFAPTKCQHGCQKREDHCRTASDQRGSRGGPL